MGDGDDAFRFLPQLQSVRGQVLARSDMHDSAAVCLAQELALLSERHSDNSELVALCDRLLLYLGKIERRKARHPPKPRDDGTPLADSPR